MAEGKLPVRRWAFRSPREFEDGPFVTAIIWKADIDAAVDMLGVKGRWLKISHEAEPEEIIERCGGMSPKQRRLINYYFADRVLMNDYDMYRPQAVLNEMARFLNGGIWVGQVPANAPASTDS